MNPSQNPKVQNFLNEALEFDENKHIILQALRKIVFKVHPKVTERMMYGGIMFTLEEDFGGIFVSKNHVSFEFSNGYMLKDPKGVFEGTGKFRRHLKIKNVEDIVEKDVEFFVKQYV